MKFFVAFILFVSIVSGTASAQIDVEYNEYRPHHLSLFIGGTHIDAGDETAFTFGVDYEYRLNKLIGVGGVAEHAVGGIDATSLLAVADIHLWRGLALQLGPGVEFVDEEDGSETFAIGRIGMLYELEFVEGFTLSPQFHYDVSSGEDAIVFGIAFGRAF